MISSHEVVKMLKKILRINFKHVYCTELFKLIYSTKHMISWENYIEQQEYHTEIL